MIKLHYITQPYAFVILQKWCSYFRVLGLYIYIRELAISSLMICLCHKNKCIKKSCRSTPFEAQDCSTISRCFTTRFFSHFSVPIFTQGTSLLWYSRERGRKRELQGSFQEHESEAFNNAQSPSIKKNHFHGWKK